MSSKLLTVRILLISRDLSLITDFCNVAQPMRIFCEICSDGQSALKRICRSKFEGILIDYKVQADAARILTAIHNSTSHRRAITFGVIEPSQRHEAFRSGLHFVLSRPLEISRVVRTLRAALPLLLQERRRYFRAPTAVSVLVRSDGCDRVHATSVNISEEGMSLEGDTLPKVGAKASVEFQLPGMTGPIVLNAEVCWTKDKLAGMQFQRVPAKIQEELRSWLEMRLEESIAVLSRS